MAAASSERLPERSCRRSRGRGGVVFFFTDGGPSVAGINPAVVAVFARALTTFSQEVGIRHPLSRPAARTHRTHCGRV